MSEIINHEVYCRDKHVQLSLAAVTPRVLGMFHITRLEQVLTLTELSRRLKLAPSLAVIVTIPKGRSSRSQS